MAAACWLHSFPCISALVPAALVHFWKSAAASGATTSVRHSICLTARRSQGASGSSLLACTQDSHALQQASVRLAVLCLTTPPLQKCYRLHLRVITHRLCSRALTSSETFGSSSFFDLKGHHIESWCFELVTLCPVLQKALCFGRLDQFCWGPQSAYELLTGRTERMMELELEQ